MTPAKRRIGFCFSTHPFPSCPLSLSHRRVPMSQKLLGSTEKWQRLDSLVGGSLAKDVGWMWRVGEC